MVVNRRTFTVKKPYFEEALNSIVELRQMTKRLKPDAVFRVYACEYGPFDTIAFEFETETLATLEQHLDTFNTEQQFATRVPEWFKRWQEITEPGGTNEIWRLVE